MMLHCDIVFDSNPELYHKVTFSETKDTIMCKLFFYYFTVIILYNYKMLCLCVCHAMTLI